MENNTTYQKTEHSVTEQNETANDTVPGIGMDSGSDAMSPPNGAQHVPSGAVPEQSGTAASNGIDGAASAAEGNVKAQNFALSPEDQALKVAQELLILEGKKDIGRATIKMAQAVFTYYSYKNGILWKGAESFEEFGRKNWGIEKSQLYRLLKTGRFVNRLMNSPQWDSKKGKLPINEIQSRALEDLPEKHWCEFWIQMTALRDPLLMTRGDIQEEVRVYMKRNAIKSVKTAGTPTTKVGRVLSKFKDLKDDLSKLKQLDLLDPRIQNLIALLGQSSEGAVDPDEPTDEDLDAIVKKQQELEANRVQGGPPFDWLQFNSGAEHEASKSVKPEEATV